METSKKKRKNAFYQESDQEKKKNDNGQEKKTALDQESDQEKKIVFFVDFLVREHVFFLFFILSRFVLYILTSALFISVSKNILFQGTHHASTQSYHFFDISLQNSR